MKNLNNWKELALERSVRIGQLEKENRELRESKENLYRAWRRATNEVYELKKELGRLDALSPEKRDEIYRNITGRELFK